MAASNPLTGTELIDCARANVKQGLETAATQCGYGNNLESFQQELKQACREIGIEIETLGDLMTEQEYLPRDRGVDIAPDTPSSL